MVPVEVVVRGYLTGSAWRDYQRERAVSGIRLPAGMRADQPFPEPLLTPQTKAPPGQHDRPLSRDELLVGGIVAGPLWERIEAAALRLYRRGVELAARRGLILVDTKYEFGTVGDELLLADEVHTPDSSRYWFADGYADRFARGQPQRKLDKEFLRVWLMERGYLGDGEPPAIPDAVRDELGQRYREAFRLLTGGELMPSALSEDEELAEYAAVIRAAGAGRLIVPHRVSAAALASVVVLLAALHRLGAHHQRGQLQRREPVRCRGRRRRVSRVHPRRRLERSAVHGQAARHRQGTGGRRPRRRRPGRPAGGGTPRRGAAAVGTGVGRSRLPAPGVAARSAQRQRAGGVVQAAGAPGGGAVGRQRPRGQPPRAVWRAASRVRCGRSWRSK